MKLYRRKIYLSFANEADRCAYDPNTNSLYLSIGGVIYEYAPVGSGLASLVMQGDTNAIEQVQYSTYAKMVSKLPKGVYWTQLPQRTLTMYEVNSSNVNLIGYDYGTEQLYVEYKDGSLYEYDDVPLQFWNGLKDADSKGSYIHWFVKLNDFPYRKVNIPYTVSNMLPNKGSEHPDGWMNV